MKTVYRAVDIIGLILTSVTLVVTVLIGYFVGGDGLGPVRGSNGEISDDYPTEITPATLAFSIWGVIYTWQFIWVIYAWTFVCRPKTSQTVFTGVYYSYVLICIFSIAWIFVFGNIYFAEGAVILILLNLVFYPTIASLAFFLSKADGAKVYDIWLTCILVLNGLLFYVTWTTIASLINLAFAIQYVADSDGTTAAYVALSLLLITVITYFTSGKIISIK